MRAQQAAFDRFCGYYNEVPPHEALDMRTPPEVYQPSRRTMPVGLPEHEYDEDVDVRRVWLDGSMKWRGNFVFIGEAFAGALVGVQQVTEEHWHHFLGPMKLGVVHERFRTVMPMTAEGN